jgi:pimeloyl-ACP methyl ester carboxylesterase
VTSLSTLYLDRTGGKIAYDDTGDGPLVIMLPGMGALRSEYRYLSPSLAKAGYRAVTADLRGQGESTPIWRSYSIKDVGEDLLALIGHIDAGPAHVICTSMSPSAAVWAATEKPDNFESMTLIAPFVRDVPPSLLQRIGLSLFLRGPWRVWGWITYYGSLYPTSKPPDYKEYIQNLRDNLKEPGRFEAMMKLGSASKKASEERLGKVVTRSMVIMGTKDPDWTDPVSEAKYVADQLSAKLFLVEGAGHYPQTEMPDKVVPVILEFLSQS